MLHKDMAHETRKRMRRIERAKNQKKKKRRPRLYISFNKHAVKKDEKFKSDEQKTLDFYNNNKALKFRRFRPVLAKRMDPFAANLKAYLVFLYPPKLTCEVRLLAGDGGAGSLVMRTELLPRGRTFSFPTYFKLDAWKTLSFIRSLILAISSAGKRNG